MSEFSVQEHTKLMSVLIKIKELLDRFYELTCQQTEILETDEIEVFEQNLSQRQEIIDEVDLLQQELGGLMEPHAPSELWLSSNEPKREEIIRLQESIQERLRETQIKNSENEKKTRQKMEYYSHEGRKAGLRRKSIGLYNQNGASGSPLYYDKRK